MPFIGLNRNRVDCLNRKTKNIDELKINPNQSSCICASLKVSSCINCKADSGRNNKKAVKIEKGAENLPTKLKIKEGNSKKKLIYATALSRMSSIVLNNCVTVAAEKIASGPVAATLVNGDSYSLLASIAPSTVK